MAVNGVEIQVGQEWTTRNRGPVTVMSRAPSRGRYQWQGSNGVRYDNSGLTGDSASDQDMMSLVSATEEIFTDFNGGGCPFLGEARVEVRLRDGTVLQSESRHLSWMHHFGNPNREIVKYRIVRDPVPSEPKSAPADTMSVSGYELLADVLHRAYKQASVGKGKERHASDNLSFENQPMNVINAMLGSIDGHVYQATKKAVESRRLPTERAVAELLGAINYLAGAVITLEKKAK